MKAERLGIGWLLLAGVLTVWLLPLVALGALQPATQSQPPPGDDRQSPRRQPANRPRFGDSERRGELREKLMQRRGLRPGDDTMRLPPEFVDWALEVMKTKLPRLHERLSKLRQENPDRFEWAFRKLMPFLKEYRALLDHKPELAETVLEEFKAEERLRELSKSYQTSKDNPEQQASISGEIEQLVRKQFELRQKRFEARLQDFEERIKDQQVQLENMKAHLQTAASRQQDLVNRRVSQVKTGRMGEGMPGMGPGFGGPGPVMDGRPPRPPPGEDFGPPRDRPPPPEDEGGGPPPNPDDGPDD